MLATTLWEPQTIRGINYKRLEPGARLRLFELYPEPSNLLKLARVICSTDCALTPISANVELSSAGSTVERQEWTTEMLAKIKDARYRIEPNTRCTAVSTSSPNRSAIV